MFEELSGQPIDENPWAIQLRASRRISQVGPIDVNPTHAFCGQHRFAGRFLINLRDAIAHGDARQILPFHVGKPDEKMAGRLYVLL